MAGYAEAKAARPIRYIVALTVYRAIWWPTAAVAFPFVLVGGFVDWLSWTAFPAIARTVQPLWGLAHRGALAVGNAILGVDSEDQPQ